MPAESPSTAAVIGAGPAGLMAAEELARAGIRVTLYDRMPSVARKFLMAGRGGLNLTHSEPLRAFLGRYGEAAERLAPAIEAFDPSALRVWCEGLGQKTFEGSSGRVFPECFKTSPLLRAWLGRLGGSGVELLTRHTWRGWNPAGDLLFGTPAGEIIVPAPGATLLALGGASWPRLGADGSWASVLAREGIEIRPLAPANCGFECRWSDVFRARFAGTPLKSIGLTFAGRTLRGEAMITDYGLEGGGIYALSAALRQAIAADGAAILTLDLRPDTTVKALGRRLARPRAGQSASTFLRKACGLSPAAIALLREPGAGSLPEAPAHLARLIKAVPVRLSAPRPLERAISTAGGLAFSEIDADFMLRRRPGTFVAGEMLDWEAPTGGYLLQATFATAVAAARGMRAWLDQWRER